MKAKSAASPMPAAIPAQAPSVVLPLRTAAAKPQDAPITIMPSTPRLSTPARSTTSSPSAAMRSGVDAVMTVSRIASRSTVSHPRPRCYEADAIGDERVAGEHVEEQHALEDLGEVERHMQRDLRGLAAEIGQGEGKPGQQDADRIEPAEKGDDDRGEAIARRDRRQELADRPGGLDDAGETGERARYREGEEDVAAILEAGKARGARRHADD